MKYITIILIFLSTIYTFSFAKNNWKENNKLGAIGVVVVALISIILPVFIL
jgi:hypothetical protein